MILCKTTSTVNYTRTFKHIIAYFSNKKTLKTHFFSNVYEKGAPKGSLIVQIVLLKLSGDVCFELIDLVVVSQS